MIWIHKVQIPFITSLEVFYILLNDVLCEITIYQSGILIWKVVFAKVNMKKKLAWLVLPFYPLSIEPDWRELNISRNLKWAKHSSIKHGLFYMTRTNSQERKSSTCISIKNITNKNRQKNVSTQKAQNVKVM